ncbi:MAG: hypothetical protein WC343_04845, partial [Bacilli bacterium]
KQTSITLEVDAFSSIENSIRYLITSELSDGLLLKDIFGEGFSLQDNKLVKGGILSVPNMPELFEEFVIAEEDLGKTVKDASSKWMLNIVVSLQLLPIDINDWRFE